MFKRRYFCGGSILAVALALGTTHAATAAAAPAPAGAAPTNGEVSEVVVTGSYIRGTPENAALPVTVVNAETLSKQGSPSPIELIKALPEAAGIIGESNQFTAG